MTPDDPLSAFIQAEQDRILYGDNPTAPKPDGLIQFQMKIDATRILAAFKRYEENQRNGK